MTEEKGKREKKEKPDPFAEQKKVKGSLDLSILDGSFYSIMDGFTTSFIAPYALFLNASNIVISLLASLPDLVGSFFQLSAIKVSEVVKSRKIAIVAGAFLQALVWLPILLLPYLRMPYSPAAMLVAFVIVNAMLSSFINPLWRSMMGDLVPDDRRGEYFGARNRITGIVSFIATFTAGGILQVFGKTHPLLGFGILFGVALVARIISSMFILSMYEKITEYDYRKAYFSLSDFVKKMPHNNYGKFVLFVCMFKAATAIASPFFVVYMLKNLRMSYMSYTILAVAEIFATLVSLQFWGRFNDERGSKMVLFITGFLIPFVPILWLFGTGFYYLMLLQLFSGAVWGGFNLAFGNFIFDATTPQKRTRCVAYFNLLHGISVFAGASLGGFLLSHFPVLTLFAISGIARLSVALILLPKLREMRLIEVSFGKSMFRNSIFIKPKNAGVIGIPMESSRGKDSLPEKKVAGHGKKLI